MPPFAYSQYKVVNLTVSTAVVTLNPAADKHPSGAWANRAIINNGAQGIRITFDGATNPSSTVGIAIAANTQFIVDGEVNVSRLRFIRSGGTDSVPSISLLI